MCYLLKLIICNTFGISSTTTKVPPTMEARTANTAADGDFVVDHETDLFEKNPEEIVIGKESITNMYDGLRKKFSVFENKVFTLYIEGMTYTEIAVKLGKSPKSVDNALQRIKSKYMLMYSNVSNR